MKGRKDENSTAHFTRNGPLSPSLLVVLMLHLASSSCRRGYKLALDAFWDECAQFDLLLPTDRPVSAAAFCNARKKLDPELIRDLVHEVKSCFEADHAETFAWKGRRVLACDGAKLSVQRSDALWKEFGGPEGGHCPQILVSTLFDVFAKMAVDVTVARFGSCERSELRSMLQRTRPGDLLLLDRGYPSFDILCELKERGIDFIVRVPTSNSFKALESFIINGGTDEIIQLDATARSKRTESFMSVRAVHRDRTNDDECVVFLTSLTNDEASSDEVQLLYAKRWAVEEYYKMLKGDYLGLGQMHSKSPAGIRQEIYAFALLACISRSTMADAAEHHDVDPGALSQKAGMLAVCDYLIRLMMPPIPHSETLCIKKLFQRIVSRLDPPRPNRSFPRRSYKPTPRWGAKGRRWEKRSGV